MGIVATCRWTAVDSGRAKSSLPPTVGGALARRGVRSVLRYGMIRTSRPANDNPPSLAYLLRTGLRLAILGAVLVAMLAYLIA